MNNKVAVVCFLWGKWPEDDPNLGATYVHKLRSSVLRNSLTPFDWYEFGDCGVPFGEDFKDLRWNLKKMFMFSEEAGLKIMRNSGISLNSQQKIINMLG